MTKKEWTSPNLLTHGSIETITEQRIEKTFGSADGFVLVSPDGTVDGLEDN